MTRILLPAALVLVGGFTACAKHEALKALQLPTAKVRLVAGSEAGDGAWAAASLGRAEHATLSTRLAAMVRKVHVQEGSVVRRGQLLVSLADDDLRGQLKAAETARDAASAHQRRIQALAAQGAATPSELEQAGSQLAQAEGAVAAVKGQLAYTEIRAPFDGVVQSRPASDGTFAGAGQPLLELDGKGGLELTASLSEEEARGLKAGAKVAFEAEGRSGEVVVTALAPGGDPTTHRQAFRAKVLRPTDLRSGAFARLRLGAGAKAEGAAVSVPASALVTRGELSGVFVAEDGHAHLRWLSLGEREDARVAVKAGLGAGEAVIDSPGELVDGQPITVEGGKSAKAESSHER